MKRPSGRAVFAVAVLAGGLLVEPAPASPGDASDLLDAGGIRSLLDVMDALATLHPGFEEESDRLAMLPADRRGAFLDAARRRNEESRELGSAIDAMLATPAYQMYFRRFTNVTPDLVRDLLLDLPYRERRAPGDIGSTLHALVRQRRAVREGLERFVTVVDLAAVEATARKWSPDGAGATPTTHLFYDSNAGSFATEGQPFLNLYAEGLFESAEPGAAKIEEIAGTMAHELMHALSEPFLYPEPGSPEPGSDAAVEDPWPRRKTDALLRSMVSEGVANHCSPPKGAVREVYEDKEVVTALLRRLETFLSDLRHGRMTEEEATAWSRDNYFDVALTLLRGHLDKRFAGAELEAKLAELTPIRPDLEHVLGWWMVSHVSRRGADRKSAVALLEEPWDLLRRYNQALGPEASALKLDPEALANLDALASLGQQ